MCGYTSVPEDGRTCFKHWSFRPCMILGVDFIHILYTMDRRYTPKGDCRRPGKTKRVSKFTSCGGTSNETVLRSTLV